LVLFTWTTKALTIKTTTTTQTTTTTASTTKYL
jgi:hypothetical protein